jgi:hypothetical protein
MENDPQITPRHDSKRILIFALVAVAIVALAAAYIAIMAGRGVATVHEDVKNTAKELLDIPGKFMTGTITQTFRESVADISSTGGDILEVATSNMTEDFKKSDTRYILGVSAGTTVSEIRVPVTFRYHIQLSDNWRLAAKDNVCIVLAPSIHPSLPPAIHTDEMEKSTTSGWARFDKNGNLDGLEESITPELERRAIDPSHIKLVRETCRQSIAAFVKKWIMKEDYWRNDGFRSIVVVFPDEAPAVKADQELEQLPNSSTVKLD